MVGSNHNRRHNRIHLCDMVGVQEKLAGILIRRIKLEGDNVPRTWGI